MNPYGVPADFFQTQANQSANSFSDPLNVSHLYPGWGMNPNYQTPSYDAPYRPAYTGPDPYAAYSKPSFMGGVGQLAFGTPPYWGAPTDHMRNAARSVGEKPNDAFMTAMQRLVMPAAVIGGVSAATNPFFSHMAQGGINRLTNPSVVGEFGPKNIGAPGFAARTLGSFGGFAVGLAATEAIDRLVFQPYIRTRQMAGTLQENFSGIAFGGAAGGVMSGRGLSGRGSAQIASEIDRIGIRDMTFSSNQVHGIAAMGMQAGLFDDLGSGQISKRVSSIAAQVKTILAISKDPNVATAIQELGKLQAGGASITGGAVSQASNAYSSIGMYASAAGASVQRVMNTVGQQGQYLYQMNGITPYLGQMAASQAFAGFSTAKRTGLISADSLARMGGLEGATQSALGAQVAGLNTPFNQVRQYNRYMLGGAQNGVVNNLSAFGQGVSGDPMKHMGNMLLYKGALDSMTAASEGDRNLENQAVEYLQSMHIPPGPNGKYSAAHIATALQAMGITQDQISAYMNMRMSQTDSESMGAALQGIRTQSKEQRLAFASQQNLENTLMSRTGRSIRKGWKGVKEGFADIGYSVSRAAGSLGDGVEGAAMWWNFGDTVKEAGLVTSELDGPSTNKSFALATFDARNPIKRGDRGGKRAEKNDTYYRRSLYVALNNSIKKGGAEGALAQKILNGEGGEQKTKEAISKYLSMKSEDPELRHILNSLDTSSGILDRAVKDISELSVEGGSSGRSLGTELNKLVGSGKGELEDLRVLGQAAALRADLHASGRPMGVGLEDALKAPQYAGLASFLGNMPTDQKIAKVRQLSSGMFSSAGMGAAILAGRLNMTAEDVIKDPSKLTRDPEVLKAIANAKGDRKTIERIMAREIAKRNGGSLAGESLPTFSNTDGEEEYAGGYQAAKAGVIAAADTIDKSSSMVDYGEMKIVTDELQRFGRSVSASGMAFLEAARIINNAAARFQK